MYLGWGMRWREVLGMGKGGEVEEWRGGIWAEEERGKDGIGKGEHSCMDSDGVKFCIVHSLQW